MRPWNNRAKFGKNKENLNEDFTCMYRLLASKNLPAMQETGLKLWVGNILWRRAWHPTPVFLPGESPRTEEPSGLQSLGSQRVGQD